MITARFTIGVHSWEVDQQAMVGLRDLNYLELVCYH